MRAGASLVGIDFHNRGVYRRVGGRREFWRRNRGRGARRGLVAFLNSEPIGAR